MKSFTWQRFLVRWAIALVVVFATFNPFGYSYYHWVTAVDGGSLPLMALTGVSLLIVYVIFMRATVRSLGPIGIGLAVAFFVAVVWVFVDFGLLSLDQSRVFTTIVLMLAATVLAVGVSWSHIRRRISGQSDIDDVDE